MRLADFFVLAAVIFSTLKTCVRQSISPWLTMPSLWMRSDRTLANEFVCFSNSGIYMQIVRRGEGRSMIEMAKEDPDSTITKVVLCRFFEYDIESGDTITNNQEASSIVDKMQVKYTHLSRAYTASFTEGYMLKQYGSSVVPTGWLKPMDFIRLTRQPDPKTAKVRLIVPHTSGTSNATGYVLPMYYEITYQLGL